MTTPQPTHFDHAGNPRMVDVSSKPVTAREATASGEVNLSAEAAAQVRERRANKGDVLAVARIAAIQAAKVTQTLIPMCHSLPLEAVTVDFEWRDNGDDVPRLRCTATVCCTGKTGVEMEAMTAVSVGCLTVYDMLKSVDREIVIGPIVLESKSGGKSGEYRRGRSGGTDPSGSELGADSAETGADSAESGRTRG